MLRRRLRMREMNRDTRLPTNGLGSFFRRAILRLRPLL